MYRPDTFWLISLTLILDFAARKTFREIDIDSYVWNKITEKQTDAPWSEIYTLLPSTLATGIVVALAIWHYVGQFSLKRRSMFHGPYRSMRRRTLIPFYCSALLTYTSMVHMAPFTKRRKLLALIDRINSLLTKQLFLIPGDIGLSRGSLRRRALSEHVALVAAALQREMDGIDANPSRNAANLGELAAHICERYSHGRWGALLDPPLLTGLTPVANRELQRVVVLVAVIVAAGCICGFLDVPGTAATILTGGIGVLVARITFGPNFANSLNLLDSMRGIQRP
ncbi:hypothetical protein ACFY7V_03485 [[Kitasatospora] papulosa]|uniref:hypothetical protein n=1 Tax=Streptomyces TaxID=1883 RepID=UPI002FEF2E99